MDHTPMPMLEGRTIQQIAETTKRAEEVEKRRLAYQQAMAKNVLVLKVIIQARLASRKK